MHWDFINFKQKIELFLLCTFKWQVTTIIQCSQIVEDGNNNCKVMGLIFREHVNLNAMQVPLDKASVKCININVLPYAQG